MSSKVLMEGIEVDNPIALRERIEVVKAAIKSV